jgi:hypothetical protein
MKNSFLLHIMVLIITCSMFSSCQSTGINSYKTFVMEEGMIHFSLEYPSSYIVDYLKPAEATGNHRDVDLFLVGPTSRSENNYTNIGIGAGPPDDYAQDAKSLSEKAERNAASWKYYELLYRGEIIVSGVHAYRLDFQNIDIVPAIAVGDEPAIEVTRRVDFDANGFIWTIFIDSPSSTAEADKVDFEHILQTFQILD